MRDRIPAWIVPLLIGLVTITAGLVTWRAGQLASSASFLDRQAIGQTILEQQQDVEAGLAAIGDAVAYVDYVADYAEAEAKNGLSGETSQQGAVQLADELDRSATNQRSAASALASARGVFGRQQLLRELATESDTPLAFDFQEHLSALQAEVRAGITSPGELNPDRFAEEANDIRDRIRSLRIAALLLVLAVGALTITQFARRPGVWLVSGVLGLTLFIATASTTFATVW